MKSCGDCGKMVARLRRRRCDTCYMRVYRRGEVPLGASCVACGETRQEVLVTSAVGDMPCVLCGNCDVVKTRARVADLADLRRLAVPARRAGRYSMAAASVVASTAPSFDPTTD